MSSSQLDTALIVLTGGRSSRMGEPKALLRFGGRTALELAVQNAVDAGLRRVVAVVGHRAEEIRAAHSFTGLPLIFDWAVNLEADSPMLVSLQYGLRAIARLGIHAFFFQPIDMPLVRPEDFTLLLRVFQEHQGVADAERPRVYLPSHDGQCGHPVLCDVSLVPGFLALPRNATPREFIRSHVVAYVETRNAGVLEDMDTRDDYKRLRDLYDARGHGTENGGRLGVRLRRRSRSEGSEAGS